MTLNHYSECAVVCPLQNCHYFQFPLNVFNQFHVLYGLCTYHKTEHIRGWSEKFSA